MNAEFANHLGEFCWQPLFPEKEAITVPEQERVALTKVTLILIACLASGCIGESTDSSKTCTCTTSVKRGEIASGVAIRDCQAINGGPLEDFELGDLRCYSPKRGRNVPCGDLWEGDEVRVTGPCAK